MFAHLRSVLGGRAQGMQWQAGTAVLPSVLLPGLLEWTNAERITRGTTELSNPAKRNGTRFARRDAHCIILFAE